MDTYFIISVNIAFLCVNAAMLNISLWKVDRRNLISSLIIIQYSSNYVCEAHCYQTLNFLILNDEFDVLF